MPLSRLMSRIVEYDYGDFRVRVKTLADNRGVAQQQRMVHEIPRIQREYCRKSRTTISMLGNDPLIRGQVRRMIMESFSAGILRYSRQASHSPPGCFPNLPSDPSPGSPESRPGATRCRKPLRRSIHWNVLALFARQLQPLIGYSQ